MAQQSTRSKRSRNLYRDLRKEIVERTLSPLDHPSFIAFFVIAVLGFGALGIWLELYVYIYPDPTNWIPNPPRRSDALRTALLTFFPAVAGTAAMQLLWAESLKHFRSAAFSMFVFILVVALYVSPSRINNESAIATGVLASMLSVWVWWIANAKQTDLLDPVDPADSIGGDDPEVDLPGSLSEFKH